MSHVKKTSILSNPILRHLRMTPRATVDELNRFESVNESTFGRILCFLAAERYAPPAKVGRLELYSNFIHKKSSNIV